MGGASDDKDLQGLIEQLRTDLDVRSGDVERLSDSFGLHGAPLESVWTGATIATGSGPASQNMSLC